MATANWHVAETQFVGDKQSGASTVFLRPSPVFKRVEPGARVIAHLVDVMVDPWHSGNFPFDTLIPATAANYLYLDCSLCNFEVSQSHALSSRKPGRVSATRQFDRIFWTPPAEPSAYQGSPSPFATIAIAPVEGSVQSIWPRRRLIRSMVGFGWNAPLKRG